jgi:hypothetical protein
MTICNFEYLFDSTSARELGAGKGQCGVLFLKSDGRAISSVCWFNPEIAKMMKRVAVLAVGNIIGALAGYEVLTAFFLEATLLRVILFGWERVPPWLHVMSAILVAVGTTISAFWILAANSRMQTPVGHELH